MFSDAVHRSPNVQHFVNDQNAKTEAWKPYFDKMELGVDKSLEKLDLLMEMQNGLNHFLLSLTPEVEQKLLKKGYLILKDSESIEWAKIGAQQVNHEGVYDAILEATKATGLLIDMKTELSAIYPSDSNSSKEKISLNSQNKNTIIENAITLRIKNVTQDFNAQAELASQFAFTNIDLQWEELKQKGSYAEHSLIICCTLFSKMTLMQMECLTRTQAVLDSVHFVSQSSKLETSLEMITKVSRTVLSNNIVVWEKYPNVSREEIDACIKGMSSVIGELKILGSNLPIQEIPDTQKTKVSKVDTGLQNIGNSCYINAVLQMLFNDTDIRKVIDETPKNNNLFLDNLRKLSKFDKSSNRALLTALREATFRLKGKGTLTGNIYTQQDAHEFLIFALDQLNWNPMKIHTCTLAENATIRHYGDVQTTNHLSVNPHEGGLQEVLDNYFTFEEMAGNLSLEINETTKNFTSWQRAILIKEYPKILFIHFKRFKIVDTEIQKNTVEIKAKLDQSVRVGEKNYHIAGFINHHGDNMHLGHYTSVVKKENGSWINYDDNQVKEFSLTQMGKEAYIVMLKRED